MIKKYRFGTPIETDSVIKEMDSFTTHPPQYIINGNVITLPILDDDMVLGLGENIRGINKRGWVYKS